MFALALPPDEPDAAADRSPPTPARSAAATLSPRHSAPANCISQPNTAPLSTPMKNGNHAELRSAAALSLALSMGRKLDRSRSSVIRTMGENVL
jgi:hypothetical protein